MAPDGFSWIDKPHLAALAFPQDREELHWLRRQGIQLLISLTEEPPRREWINDAGLLLLHVPVEDFHPPSQRQIDLCISAIAKAQEQAMGAAVHCRAGLGRTGTILACWLVAQGKKAQEAISLIRKLRPGSVETSEQVEAIEDFARRSANERAAPD